MLITLCITSYFLIGLISAKVYFMYNDGYKKEDDAGIAFCFLVFWPLLVPLWAIFTLFKWVL